MMAFILQTLLWLLLAFILGLIIGRFLKRLFCRGNESAVVYDGSARSTTSRSVRTDVDSGSSSRSAASAGGAAVTAAAVSSFSGGDSSSDDVDDREIATSGSALDKNIGDFESDNLQIIEGIGSKMESILHENGVVTWSELGGKSKEDLQGILDQYGDKYQIIDPATWIPQAKLASEGKVDELIVLQKEDGVSKLEKMLAAGDHAGFGKYKPDDLKIVEGIGPKIEQLLNADGINTWKELSTSQAASIQGILDKAGSSFRLADPESWPLQAEFAFNGEWAKLKEYQDILQGGRSK